MAPSMAIVIAGEINGSIKSGAKAGNGHVRQSRGNPAKAGSERFYRQLEKRDQSSAHEENDNISRHLFHVARAENYHENRRNAEGRFQRRKSSEVPHDRFHARQKIAGNFFHLYAEEVFHLCAGDGDGDAVGEADHNRAGDELHGGAEAGDAQYDEQDAPHQRAHVEAVYAVFHDDAENDDDEGSRGAADLSGRSAQRGNNEACDDGAVKSRLWWHTRRDRKSHCEWKSDQPYGESGDKV